MRVIPLRKVRSIVEAEVLKALAHPLRGRAYEALFVHGPATVSMLSERLDEPVGLLSYHLGQLARYDLIAEAPDLAKDRRERWWRVDAGLHWTDADFLDQPAALATSNALQAMAGANHAERFRRFRETVPSWGKEWAGAATNTTIWLRLTPDELRQVADEIHEVLNRWSTRETPADDPGRENVVALFQAFPSEV